MKRKEKKREDYATYSVALYTGGQCVGTLPLKAAQCRVLAQSAHACNAFSLVLL